MGWIFFAGIVIYITYRSFSGSGNLTNKRQSTYNSYKKPAIVPGKRLNEDRVFIENIMLGEEQQKLFNEIENSRDHFFVTGKAGTGKSILLQYLKHHSKKHLVVGAFTGVAALNVGGQTLNSLFRIPPGFIDIKNIRISGTVKTLMRHVDTVVIDEVSMVRADMMGAINVLLQQALENNLPFGGVQMILFGDPYQLPPVVADEGLHEYFAHNHGGPYCFNADVWQNTPLRIIELTHNFRQKGDEEFRNILDAIRKGGVSDEILAQLNKRCFDSIPTEGAVTLATRNAVVDRINNIKLAELETPVFEYQAKISGNLERSAYPTEEFLKLKKGAQVMLLKNDPEKRWVNGTVGTVDSLSKMHIKVRINGEIVYSIPQVTWSKTRYVYNQETREIEQETISSFTQFPLRLAWAFTIHKSQGKALESFCSL